MKIHNTKKTPDGASSKFFIIFFIFFLALNTIAQDSEIIIQSNANNAIENGSEIKTESLDSENSDQNTQNQFIKVNKKFISIMIDPAGDAQDTGRIVDDGFERNLTLQVAQEIKNFFEYDRSIRIIISRFSGETLEPLQNISFANRLNVDFYLNINVCQNSQEDKNYQSFDNKKIFIYYHILNPISDKWPKKFDDLSFIKIDDIYLKNVSKNIDLANIFSKTLKSFTKKISVNPPIGLPLKELVGLKSPALSCEIIVNSRSDIKDFIDPICQALKKINEQIS